MSGRMIIFAEKKWYRISNGDMKELVKRYWWIAVLVLVLPVVINFVLQIPTFTLIVGDSETWLSFWGGYLGVIISASVAFILFSRHKGLH